MIGCLRTRSWWCEGGDIVDFLDCGRRICLKFPPAAFDLSASLLRIYHHGFRGCYAIRIPLICAASSWGIAHARVSYAFEAHARYWIK